MTSTLFPVLYEDADLLVINKPAGLVCHPTKGDAYSSLISRVRLYMNSLSGACGGESRGEVASSERSTINPQLSTSASSHLVNRLDRETSGVTVVAKSAAVAGELGRLWESREVEKEYLAIVHGHVRDDRGLIDAPLGKDEQSRVAIKDCVRPDGASAQTEFHVMHRFTRQVFSDHRPLTTGVSHSPSSILHPPSSAFTVLRLLPRTGRKHQIRIHLAHLGHPIVGDKIYGGDEDLYLALVENRMTDEQRAQLILPHHALHGSVVKFSWRGQNQAFTALPEPWFTDFKIANSTP